MKKNREKGNEHFGDGKRQTDMQSKIVYEKVKEIKRNNERERQTDRELDSKMKRDRKTLKIEIDRQTRKVR